MTPEGIVQQHLKDRVKATGGTFRKMKYEGRNGAPDALCWWPPESLRNTRMWVLPVFAFFELKRWKGPTRILQEREHARLRAAGFKIYKPQSKDEVDEALIDLGVWNGTSGNKHDS